jgi:CDP-diacylglycerol--glycerol-3-phosphate 3-phosphatidyltransferase
LSALAAFDRLENLQMINMRITPNIITFSRILLIPLLIVLILNNFRYSALILFLIMGMMDFIDGYLARHRNLKTRLGGYLDPLADKILMTSVLITMCYAESLPVKVPQWLMIIIIGRDAGLLIGGVIIWNILKNWRVQPSILGKATTLFQILTVIFTLIGLKQTALKPIWIITAVITLISGIDYIYKGSKLVWGRKKD